MKYDPKSTVLNLATKARASYRVRTRISHQKLYMISLQILSHQKKIDSDTNASGFSDVEEVWQVYFYISLIR
jgi:hypothetical protein